MNGCVWGGVRGRGELTRCIKTSFIKDYMSAS